MFVIPVSIRNRHGKCICHAWVDIILPFVVNPQISPLEVLNSFNLFISDLAVSHFCCTFTSKLVLSLSLCAIKLVFVSSLRLYVFNDNAFLFVSILC